MKLTTPKKTLSIAVGAAFGASLAFSPVVIADSNPFGVSELPGGYMQVAGAEGSCGVSEGSCGSSSVEPVGPFSDVSISEGNQYGPTDGHYFTPISFDCPSGTHNNINVPWKSEAGRKLKTELAVSASCNFIDRMLQVQQECQALFGNRICMEQ